MDYTKSPLEHKKLKIGQKVKGFRFKDSTDFPYVGLLGEIVQIFKDCVKVSFNQFDSRYYPICDELYDNLVYDKAYPKVMLVSNIPNVEPHNAIKRVVFMEKNGKFIAWSGAETLEEAEYIIGTTRWNYAVDLPEVTKYTKAEIAKLIGKNIDEFEIEG